MAGRSSDGLTRRDGWILVPTTDDGTRNNYFEPEIIAAARLVSSLLVVLCYTNVLMGVHPDDTYLRLSGTGLPLTACFFLETMTLAH